MIWGLLALGALVAVPAAARASVYCVHQGGSCPGGEINRGSDLAGALSDADSNAGPDSVEIGAGTYSGGPFASSSGDQLTVTGAGQGQTTLSAGVAQTILQIHDAAGSMVHDLTLAMAPGAGGLGLDLQNTAASKVTVSGTPTDATGVRLFTSSLVDSTISLPNGGSGDLGISSGGGTNEIDRTAITAQAGVEHSSPNVTDLISLSSIQADGIGVTTDGGTVNIDDTLIDLGTSPGATGLCACNGNYPTNRAMSLNARHLTIVGGASGSQGIRAFVNSPASGDDGDSATGTLKDSVISGPDEPIVVQTNNGEHASVTSSYSNYDPSGNIVDPQVGGDPPGTATLTEDPPHTNTNNPPGFINASSGNYKLAAGSALIDAGNPNPLGVPGTPPKDLGGSDRVRDGNCDGFAYSDIGAYEYQPNCPTPPSDDDTTPPETKIDKKPKRKSHKRKPMITFSANEQANFRCKLDKKPFALCTSPYVKKLKPGKHTFRVEATDVSGNTDTSPAKVKFKIKR